MEPAGQRDGFYGFLLGLGFGDRLQVVLFGDGDSHVGFGRRYRPGICGSSNVLPSNLKMRSSICPASPANPSPDRRTRKEPVLSGSRWTRAVIGAVDGGSLWTFGTEDCPRSRAASKPPVVSE